MIPRTKKAIYFILLVIFLSGCVLPGSPVIRPTLTRNEVYGTAGITVVPTQTRIPATLTSTTVPKIQLHSGYNKLYTYPEAGFPMKAEIYRNEPFEIVGRLADAKWVQISTSNDLSAWIPVEELDILGEVDLMVYPLVDPYPAETPAILDWKGSPIKRLCIHEVTTFIGTYAIDHPEAVPEPVFSEQVLGILHAAGIQTMPVGESCDGTLNITTSVDPRGKLFSEATTNLKRYCYSGVNINSDWVLEQGEKNLKFNIKKTRGTLDRPLYCIPLSAYHSELTHMVHTGLNTLWGMAAVIPMLEIDDPIMNENAIQMAGASGRRGLPAVPALISYLGDADHDEKALSALKTITGKNFRYDATAWKNWWLSTITVTPTPSK